MLIEILQMYNVYIGKSIHAIEGSAVKVGFSHDNQRRSYTLHMQIIYSYAFDDKKTALMAEKKLIEYIEQNGYQRAFVAFNPSELKTQPNRTYDWFYIPEPEQEKFLQELNAVLGAFHLTAKIWQGEKEDA